MIYRIYTGPTLVKSVAEKLRALDINVRLEGTEHVYIRTTLTREEVSHKLNVSGISAPFIIPI